MGNELNTRKKKLLEKLNNLETEPQTQAEKKGQISESLRLSEEEKNKNEVVIEETENKIFNLNSDLNFFTSNNSASGVMAKKPTKNLTALNVKGPMLSIPVS